MTINDKNIFNSISYILIYTLNFNLSYGLDLIDKNLIPLAPWSVVGRPIRTNNDVEGRQKQVKFQKLYIKKQQTSVCTYSFCPVALYYVTSQMQKYAYYYLRITIETSASFLCNTLFIVYVYLIVLCIFVSYWICC